MNLRQLCAAAAVFGVTGATWATGTVAVVCNFSAVGDYGPVQNPHVRGVVTVQTTGPEGEYDNDIYGVFFKLKPLTTYDVYIRNGSETFGAAPENVFTTNFFGFGFFHLTLEDTPGSLAENPKVDIFIDGDGDPSSVTSTEARAFGQGCGCP